KWGKNQPPSHLSELICDCAGPAETKPPPMTTPANGSPHIFGPSHSRLPSHDRMRPRHRGRPRPRPPAARRLPAPQAAQPAPPCLGGKRSALCLQLDPQTVNLALRHGQTQVEHPTLHTGPLQPGTGHYVTSAAVGDVEEKRQDGHPRLPQVRYLHESALRVVF